MLKEDGAAFPDGRRFFQEFPVFVQQQEIDAVPFAVGFAGKFFGQNDPAVGWSELLLADGVRFGVEIRLPVFFAAHTEKHIPGPVLRILKTRVRMKSLQRFPDSRGVGTGQTGQFPERTQLRIEFFSGEVFIFAFAENYMQTPVCRPLVFQAERNIYHSENDGEGTGEQPRVEQGSPHLQGIEQRIIVFVHERSPVSADDGNIAQKTDISMIIGRNDSFSA